jgi:NAD(P)H-nitrite reductase large subunit
MDSGACKASLTGLRSGLRGNDFVMAIVCHCTVVRERTIERAIRRGATTLDALKAECGAGDTCRGCEPFLLELLDEHAPARYAESSVRIARA